MVSIGRKPGILEGGRFARTRESANVPGGRRGSDAPGRSVRRMQREGAGVAVPPVDEFAVDLVAVAVLVCQRR